MGLGSDNVLDYEVVLADGSIVHANESERSDLYWALKSGSTNYGIVTRFLMPAIPRLRYGLFKQLATFTDRLKEDPHGMSAVSVAWSPEMKDYAIWSPNVYLAPQAYPSPSSMASKISSHSKARCESRIWRNHGRVDMLSPGGRNSQWFSVVFKNDAELPWDIQLKGREIFEPYHDRPGAAWAITVQPINEGMIAAGHKRGGTLLLGCVFWNDPEDSAVMKAKTQEYIKAATELARERGLLNKYIYLNYALDTQHVFESYGAENLKKMREIKSKYDPDNLLEHTIDQLSISRASTLRGVLVIERELMMISQSIMFPRSVQYVDLEPNVAFPAPVTWNASPPTPIRNHRCISSSAGTHPKGMFVPKVWRTADCTQWFVLHQHLAESIESMRCGNGINDLRVAPSHQHAAPILASTLTDKVLPDIGQQAQGERRSIA
ncbi:FAD-binding domain-containing protein [Salix suchowensis]|nr:FAD-binding domain-containing protein [Salix suchowensis]